MLWTVVFKHIISTDKVTPINEKKNKYFFKVKYTKNINDQWSTTEKASKFYKK